MPKVKAPIAMCISCRVESDNVSLIVVDYKGIDNRRVLENFCEKCELEFYKARFYGRRKDTDSYCMET